LLLWGKSPNSGNILKLLIPNNSWKTISGRINYPCKVTTQKISFTEMDNRGSKSDYRNISVKEQRVDGGWHKNWLSFFGNCSCGVNRQILGTS
jgi:hypothetical protein